MAGSVRPGGRGRRGLAGRGPGAGRRAGGRRGHGDLFPRRRPALRRARPGLEPAGLPDRDRRPGCQSVDGPAAGRARPRGDRRRRPAGRPGRGTGLGARGAPPRGGVHRERGRPRGPRPAGADRFRPGSAGRGRGTHRGTWPTRLIDADLAGAAPGDQAGLHDRLLGTHSVALLNRGTPSSLVTPDGTLHIALMRASSAWPAGVWIDGARRTVPATAAVSRGSTGATSSGTRWRAGAGDWRDAGFVAGRPGVQPRPARRRDGPA